MDLFKLEDQFYPLMMRIYQAKHLMEDISEYSVCTLSQKDSVQRYYAFTDLLQDVLETAVNDAEQFQQLLENGQRPEQHS